MDHKYAEALGDTAIAIIEEDVEIGEGTRVWNYVQIRPRAKIGRECTIGSHVHIGKGVVIGDRCKIEDFVFIPEGVELGDDVFVGPHTCFTNDRNPSAGDQWDLEPTVVRNGAVIGAGCTILCGVEIGEGSLVGAGATVINDVGPGKRIVTEVRIRELP